MSDTDWPSIAVMLRRLEEHQRLMEVISANHRAEYIQLVLALAEAERMVPVNKVAEDPCWCPECGVIPRYHHHPTCTRLIPAEPMYCQCPPDQQHLNGDFCEFCTKMVKSEQIVDLEGLDQRLFALGYRRIPPAAKECEHEEPNDFVGGDPHQWNHSEVNHRWVCRNCGTTVIFYHLPQPDIVTCPECIVMSKKPHPPEDKDGEV